MKLTEASHYEIIINRGDTIDRYNISRTQMFLGKIAVYVTAGVFASSIIAFSFQLGANKGLKRELASSAAQITEQNNIIGKMEHDNSFIAAGVKELAQHASDLHEKVALLLDDDKLSNYEKVDIVQRLHSLQEMSEKAKGKLIKITASHSNDSPTDFYQSLLSMDGVYSLNREVLSLKNIHRRLNNFKQDDERHYLDSDFDAVLNNLSLALDGLTQVNMKTEKETQRRRAELFGSDSDLPCRLSYADVLIETTQNFTEAMSLTEMAGEQVNDMTTSLLSEVGITNEENDNFPDRMVGAWVTLTGAMSAYRESLNEFLSIPVGNPITNYEANSLFGMREDPFTGQMRPHRGIDYAAPSGTPVITPSNGQVVFSGPRGAYGNFVEVDHGNGLKSRYAHLSKIHVQKKDIVSKGALLGEVGTTGRSTGNHLHYEVIVNNKRIDPIIYTDAAQASVDCDILTAYNTKGESNAE